MIRVSKEEYARIRNRVDHIAEQLSGEGDMSENNEWMINTIKDLLLDVYLLQHSSSKNNIESHEEETYYAMRTKIQDTYVYLEDVWEPVDYGDESSNYSFTPHLSKAKIFHEYSLDSSYGAPKYLWNDQESSNINTIDEMCEYFQSEMVKVLKQKTWKEI